MTGGRRLSLALSETKISVQQVPADAPIEEAYEALRGAYALLVEVCWRVALGWCGDCARRKVVEGLPAGRGVSRSES